MRSLSLRILESFPVELRALMAAEDRCTAAGHGDEGDMAFDHELSGLCDLVASISGSDPDDATGDIEAIADAVTIQRARDVRAARRAEGELRSASTCSGCFGDGGAR